MQRSVRTHNYIFHAETNLPEFEELGLLLALVKDYEDKFSSIS